MKDSSLIESVGARIITLPGEMLVLVERKHWSTFFVPLLFMLLSFCFIFIVLYLFFTFIPEFLPAFFLVAIVVFNLIATIAAKSVIDWYFNLYVITNRKIAEVSYRPLSSRRINEILLDQVRCTEIDTRTEGIFNDLLDIGDVVITFDRPTHEEEFTLKDVKNPKRIEFYLEKIFCTPTALYGNNIFLKRKAEPKWRYMENSEPASIKSGGEVLWTL